MLNGVCSTAYDGQRTWSAVGGYGGGGVWTPSREYAGT